MLNSTYAEQIVKSCEEHLSNKNEFIDKMVDSTFSEEVLSDLKEGLKETSNLKLISLNPAVLCKLLMSALLNKEYVDLPELFSSVDLRGLHIRKKNVPVKIVKEPKPKLPARHAPRYTYHSDENSYDYMMRKIGGCLQVIKPDEEFNKAVQSGLEKFTYQEGDDPLEYIASMPQGNICLVEISTLLARIMCSYTYEWNLEFVNKVCKQIHANMEYQVIPPEMTYNLMPVGNGFIKNFIKPDTPVFARYHWDRKHTRVWYNLLSVYACSMFRRHLRSTEQIADLFDAPFSKGSAFTCYVKNSKNNLHTRMFGVFAVADFYEILSLALKYYDVHPRAFGAINARNEDIFKLIKIPCVTGHIGLESIEKCAGFARLYSSFRMW